MSYSSGKWDWVPISYPCYHNPAYKHFTCFFAEIVETAVDLEPLTQPTVSQNDFLAKYSVSADVQQTVYRGAELREQKPRNVLTSGKHQKIRLVSAKARGPCDPPKCKCTRYTIYFFCKITIWAEWQNIPHFR